ncbi:MAG: APC family permease [Cyanobacteriota bacterium]|nr:APC family permease [Cyanobacteriota bacterium]
MSAPPPLGPPAAAPQGRLLQLLGVGFGLAGAVGGTIGAGILRAPGLVAEALASPALILAAWLVGGLYALIGALAVAELGAALPRAGGWTVYARRCFGDGAGFSVGGLDWLGHCVGLAWEVTTLGQFAAALLPAGLPLGPGAISSAIALASLVGFALLQLLGLRAGSRSQELLSLVKAVAFLALVAACFLLGGPSRTGIIEAPLLPPLQPPAGALALGLAIVAALQAVIVTYDGWHSPVYFAEEFQDPGRDLPRSLLAGVAAVITIYLLVNGALLWVLPVPLLAASPLPVAEAAAHLLGPASGQLMTGLGLVSLLGLINATIMSSPRILYGLARDGLLGGGPAALALQQVNGGGTPVTAVLATAAVAALLVLSGSFSLLLAVAAFLYVLLYLIGFTCLFVLRWREPELPRPCRAWGHPWTTAVVWLGSLAFLLTALVGNRGPSLTALALASAIPLLYQVLRTGAPPD